MKWYNKRVYPRRKPTPDAPQDDMRLMLLLIFIIICGVVYAKLTG